MRAASIMILFVLLGCTNGASPDLRSYQIVKEAEHWGEYLQALSANEVATFKRDSKTDGLSGLVKVNLNNLSLQVLDSNAVQGKDLIYQAPFLAYRVNSQLLTYSLEAASALTLQTPSEKILKLRTFIKRETSFVLGVDLAGGGAALYEFNLQGEFLRKLDLSGSPRVHAQLIENREFVLLREPLRVAVYEVVGGELKEFCVIQEGLSAQYAKMISTLRGFGLAYLDDLTGTLQWVQISPDGKIIESQKIDGEPQRNYLGMDIDLKLIGDQPLISYMDGWALKLKLARRTSEGIWKVRTTDFSGAVGFYSQILSIGDNQISLAFHNFRTDHLEDRRQTFEDLATAIVALP